MYKIGVIGDKDSILGFSGIGFDIYPAYTKEKIKSTIQKMANSNYAIIYITEQASIIVQEEFEKYKTSIFPAIITIPGNKENSDFATEKIRNSVKKAIGIDILKK